MWLLVLAAAVLSVSGPDGVDPSRVAEQTLGGDAGRMAVVFSVAVAANRRGRAVFYVRTTDRWCEVGTGDYVRGSNHIDRGGRHPSIWLIDRQEWWVEMFRSDRRLVLMRRGKLVRALDVPASGCK